MQETSRIPPSDRRAAFLSSADLRAEHAQSYRVSEGNHLLGNRKVTDHLANERTFLAWIRTALAVITFGSALGRLRGPLREQRGAYSFLLSSPALFVGGLTTLGVGFMLVALVNFLQLRREIEQEHFHPRRGNAILLTILSCLMASILALFITSS